jgi:hypothetical protein
MMPFTAEKFGAAHASLIVVICGRQEGDGELELNVPQVGRPAKRTARKSAKALRGFSQFHPGRVLMAPRAYWKGST